MSRVQRGAPTQSPYITRAGWEMLNNEQESLWKKRREVVKRLSAAAAEGDRSENAEYIYRKKQLREMDRRIRYLQKRLPDLKVVDRVPEETDQVFFGAWVTLGAAGGSLSVYRIVGTDEFDPKKNWISVDSPMARALLGRRVADTVTVATPGGRVELIVREVGYSDRED